MSKLRIAVDFDGVLNSYKTDFTVPEEIPDPPVEGAIDWLNALQEEFDVIIFTTRATTIAGVHAVRNWLWDNGCFEYSQLIITAQKMPCHVYIDDRGYRFNGTTFPSVEELRTLKPWHKEVKVGQELKRWDGWLIFQREITGEWVLWTVLTGESPYLYDVDFTYVNDFTGVNSDGQLVAVNGVVNVDLFLSLNNEQMALVVEKLAAVIREAAREAGL